jgi:hypothetical protein
MAPRPHRKLLFDFAFAICLIALGVTVVVLWLLMVLLALRHALDPWSNAGALLYGLGFVFLAAIFCVPGSAWARSLSEEFESPWSLRARIAAKTGSFTLVLGCTIAVGLLVATKA